MSNETFPAPPELSRFPEQDVLPLELAAEAPAAEVAGESEACAASRGLGFSQLPRESSLGPAVSLIPGQEERGRGLSPISPLLPSLLLSGLLPRRPRPRAFPQRLAGSLLPGDGARLRAALDAG